MNVIKKDELKFLLEKDIFKLLKEDQYIIYYENPLKLINKSRFDLNAKLIYLDGYINNTFNHKELYDSFIKAFTLGTFVEPGNNNKNTTPKKWQKISFERYKKLGKESVNLNDLFINFYHRDGDSTISLEQFENLIYKEYKESFSDYTFLNDPKAL